MGTISAVTTLRPKPTAFHSVVSAFFDGDFEFVASSLAKPDSIRETVLAVRALLRSGRAEAAVQAVEGPLHSGAVIADAERAELLMLRAAANSRLGRDCESDFIAARVFVYSSGAAALEAELNHVEAFRHLLNSDFDKSAQYARNALSIRAFETEQARLIPAEHSHARAYDLLAFLAARSERYIEQRSLARLAIEQCDASPVRDNFLEGHLLWNLAIFAREFGDDGYVRQRFDGIPPLRVLARPRYEILRCLAWSNALRGDYLGTFRDLRSASEIATTVPQRIQATLDRSYFSRELNQSISAREELDFADRLSNGIDWNDFVQEDGAVQTLVHLSEALSAINVARARRLFERYKVLKAKLPTNALASVDRRARAEELVADATITKFEGNCVRSTKLLLEAFEIWDSLGYFVRAALVARKIFDLNGCEKLADYASVQASLHPLSWFAANLKTKALPALS